MCRVNIVHKKCEDTKEKIPKRKFVGHIIKQPTEKRQTMVNKTVHKKQRLKNTNHTKTGMNSNTSGGYVVSASLVTPAIDNSQCM